MENSFFIFTNINGVVEIERFHICTWEFNENSSLVEFGFEVSKNSLRGDQISISLFIPWFLEQCNTKDLYDKLSVAENSRFIFNDSVDGTDSLDGGRNKFGVIHKFNHRNELCILPISFDKNINKVITLNISLQAYNNHYKSDDESRPNVYFRFWIKPQVPYISMRKKGLNRSTIIYDIKINERRNIPDDQLTFFRDKHLCTIKNCFSFNIIPNKYDIVFFDSSSLKNVRTLEYDSFNKYLGDKRVKKDDLIVVFNKKEIKLPEEFESFSFFSIYSKERIGPGQFAAAVLINIVCGVLLFIPAYRKAFNPEIKLSKIWWHLPLEIYIALAIALATVAYFVWPSIISAKKNISDWIKRQ